MRYYRNLSFKQIADMTGVSINTARSDACVMLLINMRRIAKGAILRLLLKFYTLGKA